MYKNLLIYILIELHLIKFEKRTFGLQPISRDFLQLIDYEAGGAYMRH